MDVISLDIAEVKLITPKRFGDDRGYFSETYKKSAFQEAGVDCDFIQDNQSHSAARGTLRGLHYQAPPYAQAKLVRVLAGAIIDVAVDARKTSETFGQWVKAELSAENGAQLYVPAGFLHGFVTTEADTIVSYKVDAYYNKESDGAVMWNDPALGIDWGVNVSDVTLSDKDKNAPSWNDFNSPF